MLISEIGEFDLIERLEKILPQEGDGVVTAIGDDCAVLDVDGEQLLWTTDAAIEGVHFLPYLATPEQIGSKALLSNLSDVAAMGGRPRYATLSISLPSDAAVEWVEGLYRGIAEQAREAGVAIVGGNTSRSPYAVRIDISVIGTAPAAEILRRSGAKAGDVVLVTGTVGDAYCGLESVFHPTIPVNPDTRNILIERYRSPIPRLAEARVIAKSGLASAMMDISDGLSSDLLHICDASKVGVELRIADLPISDGVREFSLVSGVDPCHYALVGGDDYGLLLTAPSDGSEKLIRMVREKTGTVLTAIGTIVESEKTRTLILPNGGRTDLSAEGWQHFGALK